MAKKKATTFLTFAVTFQVPPGVTIAQARQDIKNSITEADGINKESVKVHLLNKEVKYG